MIVYLATYPRSGSDVLQQAIYLNFGHWTADGYNQPSALDRRLDAHPTPHRVNGFPDGLWWPEWMYAYTGWDGVRRRMVGQPALKRLHPKARQRLAADPCLYFVKTHEAPYSLWFPGEKVVRMVRDPMAAIASHHQAQKKVAATQAKSMEQLIRGDGAGGDWSAYHRAWRDAAPEQLLFSYEAAVHDPAPMVREVADFLSLPLGPVVAEPQLRDPGAGPDGWSEALSSADIDLIRRLHGEAADELGYRLGVEEAA